MRQFFSDITEIVWPFGRRRLLFILFVMVGQTYLQLLAIFSLLPFLQAASDVVVFRASKIGAMFVWLAGGGSDERVILFTGITSLLVLLLGNVSALYADFARGKYAHQLGHWLRSKLMGQLLERKYEYFLGVNSSALLKNLIEDVGVFSQSVLVSSLDIVSRSSLVFLLAISVLVLEPVIFMFAITILVVFYFLFMVPVRRRAARASDAVLGNIRALYFEISQILTGIKPILATDRGRYFVRRSEAASFALSHEMPRIPIYSGIPRSALEILVFGGLISWVLVTLLAGGSVVSLMPRVGIIAIIAYRLMPSLQLMFGQSISITSHRQSMSEVLKLLREQGATSAYGDAAVSSVRVAQPLAWHKAIKLDDISFVYAGAEQRAIEQVSIEIGKGQQVAFVGPTGSGKSTLIDLVLALLEPTSGRMLIDGKPLELEDAPRWRRSVGYVPQDLFLYDATIAENIAFGENLEELDLAKVRHVAQIAQASEFIEREVGLGYFAQVGERGVRLSGGQRQRLALARALYHDPNVLILDEATSALDQQTEQKVVESLSHYHERLTVITVTHRLNTIRHYDQVHLVDNGRILVSGNFEELRRHPAYQRFAE